jgi:ribosome maturation factor RimP
MRNNSKSELKKLRKRMVYQDFAEEIVGVEVRVMLHDGKPLIGRIIEAKRYWIKLAVGGAVYYVNKAFVVYIQPVQELRK